MLGKFYGVSVGCGDPELMTLKAVRVLNQCEVVAVPVSNGKTTAFDIAKQVVDFSNKTILYLKFPMLRDKSTIDTMHTKHANTIMEYLKQGLNVAMVNLGDVSIYSTCAYIVEKLKPLGVPVENVSGVTSICECANRLTLPLTTMNQPIHIVPSSCDTLEEILSLGGTTIIMKTSRDTTRLRTLLNGRDYYVCQNCDMSGEKFSKTLDDSTSYFTIIIVRG
jgi:precorrin-2 C(20)-methyltransferase